MNIKNFIGAAKKQFSGLDNASKHQVLEKYGTQELLLTGNNLAAFVIYNLGSIRSAKKKANRFYTWYALNYGIAQDWNIRLHGFNLYDIDQIKIYPMQQYEEEGEILVRRCENNSADFWSVYACSKEEEYCIADCKDRVIATHFEHLLRLMIARWRIRLLSYEDLVGKRHIYSSHMLEFMMIDRKIASKQHEEPILHSILLLPNASPGTFYQNLPSLTADDQLIKSLVREAGF